MSEAKKKIFITGVNGFIGQWMVRQFLGHDLMGLDIQPDCTIPGVERYLPMRLPSSDFETIIADWRPDWVLHCAGSASVAFSLQHPADDYQAGPDVCVNIADAIRKAGLGTRILFISSAAVYGNPVCLPVNETHPVGPVSPYGYHKWMSEIILREYAELYGIRSVILRVFSCYGEGLRKQLLWDIARKIDMGEVHLSGTGNETRDFVHVSDLTALTATIVNSSSEGGLFNVGTGRQSSVAFIAGQICAELGVPEIGVFFDGKSRPGDPHHWKADITAARGLGWNPAMSMEAGIGLYCRWYRGLDRE